MRILIAEDDPKLLKSLVHIFELNHYAVDGVDNGIDAYDFAFSGEYDGLVLDIMMPGMDGVTLLKKLRAAGITTPALFLTARTEIDQRIEGLDAGADDYLPKPFSTGELLARVRAMLRRKDHFTPRYARLRLASAQSLHLRADVRRQSAGAQRQGISSDGNAYAKSECLRDRRPSDHAYLGMEHERGYERRVGTHLQYPQKAGCSRRVRDH